MTARTNAASVAREPAPDRDGRSTGPEAVRVVEVHGSIVAQAPVERIRVFVDLVGERIEADGLDGRHWIDRSRTIAA
jgi:hypothetical protein